MSHALLKYQLSPQMTCLLEEDFFSLTLKDRLGGRKISWGEYKDLIHIRKTEKDLTLIKKNEGLTKKKIQAIHSTFQKTFIGLSQGYLFYLKVVGIGYKVFVSPISDFYLQQKVSDHFNLISSQCINSQSSCLSLKVGYSHQTAVVIPKNLFVFCPNLTTVGIYGSNLEDITGFAARLRQIQIPEKYKGKGIRFQNEIVLCKVGKKK